VKRIRCHPSQHEGNEAALAEEHETAMKSTLRYSFLALLMSVSLILAACSGLPGGGNGGGGGGGGGGTTTYTIGGQVTGLQGSGLILQDNGGDNLAITATGGFTFATKVSGAYAVTVFAQPTNPAQTCTVTANGSGTASANVTNVQVTCAAAGTLSIGGTVTGLAGTNLVLQDNGGDNLAITGTGTVNFTFATLLANGAHYAVTVLSQPTNPTQTCAVTNGTGTASANVTTVQVACTSGSLTIGGHVSDLIGKGLVLQNNGGDNLTMNATGDFTFATPVANSGPYNVTILTQPTSPAQTCIVASGTGTATANVTTVSVSCGPIFTIGGTVTGLLGSGLVLLDNGSDNLTISGTGTVNFTFKTPLANNESYAVTVLTQPTSPVQTCTVTANGSGTAIGNIINVQIACSQPKFSVSGVVVGLVPGPGDTVEVQDNAGDDLFVTGDTSFTFPTQFTYGTTYSVNLFLPPTSQPQPCTVFNATAVITADVSDVIVDCQHNDWAWIFPGPAGPTINQYGTGSLPIYTVGKPILPPSGPNDNTPGGRDFPMAWTDTQGRRWLFGGYGLEVTHTPNNHVPGLLNDMWVWPSEYGWWQPGGWIPANLPIAEDSSGLSIQYNADTTSLQAQDRYGSYGTQGAGVSCAALNQNPACTTPGSRWGGVTWTDAAGNLWMFGGQGLANASYGLLNDVWEFTPGVYCGADPACAGTTPPASGTGIWTGTWTWQAGSSVANQTTTAAFPGGRWAAANYTDAAGNVWMFGGQGYDSAGNVGLLNDLWSYNIGSGTWTLVFSTNGNVADQNGVYGTQGTPAAGNAPGGREGAVLLTDASGTIWLFGGFGMDSIGTTGVTPNGTPKGATLNDLWKFSGGQWTWVAGSNLANQNGVYGTQTVAAATNMPGSRWGSASWSDPTGGELWLFGGFGYGSTTTIGTGFLNDVWEYTISTGQWTWWKGSADVNQSGTYITTPINLFQLYYTNNIVGARRGAARWLPDPLGYVYVFGGEGYDATAGGPYGDLNDIWGYLPFP
jgi:Galactose oxidase, central domain